MRSKKHQQRKNTNNETDNEKTLVKNSSVVREKIYFNLLDCGKNILNRLYATCERACMEHSRNKYYT